MRLTYSLRSNLWIASRARELGEPPGTLNARAEKRRPRSQSKGNNHTFANTEEERNRRVTRLICHHTPAEWKPVTPSWSDEDALRREAQNSGCDLQEASDTRSQV